MGEKRTWTLSVTRPAEEHERMAHPEGVKIAYDKALWAELDRAVDQAKLIGGERLFWALSNAGRHPEAYQIAKTFTSAPNPNGLAWYLLGVAASRLNFGEETKLAYGRARALDPTIYHPRPLGTAGAGANPAEQEKLAVYRSDSTGIDVITAP